MKRDNPALPRIIQAVRPLVLPKLREENERGKGRGGAKAKKKGVKDVVIEGKSFGLLVMIAYARLKLLHCNSTIIRAMLVLFRRLTAR